MLIDVNDTRRLLFRGHSGCWKSDGLCLHRPDVRLRLTRSCLTSVLKMLSQKAPCLMQGRTFCKIRRSNHRMQIFIVREIRNPIWTAAALHGEGNRVAGAAGAAEAALCGGVILSSPSCSSSARCGVGGVTWTDGRVSCGCAPSWPSMWVCLADRGVDGAFKACSWALRGASLTCVVASTSPGVVTSGGSGLTCGAGPAAYHKVFADLEVPHALKIYLVFVFV